MRGPDGTLHLEGEERFYGARASSLREEHSEPRALSLLNRDNQKLGAPIDSLTRQA